MRPGRSGRRQLRLIRCATDSEFALLMSKTSLKDENSAQLDATEA